MCIYGKHFVSAKNKTKQKTTAIKFVVKIHDVLITAVLDEYVSLFYFILLSAGCNVIELQGPTQIG